MSAEDVAVPMAVWRRCLANVGRALAVLVRPVRIDPKTPWLLPRRELAIATVAALVIFVLGMVFIDGPAARAVQQLPHWLHSFFDAITDYGKSGWFLWPLGILFLVLAALPPIASPVQQRVLAAIMVRVGFLFTAIAIPGLFDTIIKRLIGRARPFVGGHLDPTLFHLLVWRPDYASLPSGHATNVFAVLVAFASLWPRTRTYFLIYALLIVFSRVVVTAHYPTDVLTGALVGTVGALMVRRWFAMRRLGFSYGPDGVPHLYPGPSRRRIKAVARAVLAD
ncbi:MAG TPA: phosphatase PAP2 family protein [Pseudolabrys sp.]|uniref:phosphatase PAP2 family protein n=1 Tax=Pseudolabrys sp. TaxID=1960880 RepID=UPI002DDD71C8|nr:phosphatase PAP2 family protein [Pseudolabrys sp.]HEV2627216.1 phosphatase PAP2 family protein [Pseudolabrys sp.]